METNQSFQKMLAACKSDPGTVQRARWGGEILAHAAECQYYSEIKVCASATSIIIKYQDASTYSTKQITKELSKPFS